MATTLRGVLQAFEHANGPMSMTQLAHDLNVPSRMLDSMIDYWVRKGRLRESSSQASCCSSCGHSASSATARRYELVPKSAAPEPPAAGCGCGCGHDR